MGSPWLGILGLIVAAGGFVAFFYPKPPALDFTAFLGGDRRLFSSLISIVVGGVLALIGFWGL